MKTSTLSVLSALFSFNTLSMAQMPPDRFGAGQDQRPGAWGGAENRPAPVLPGQTGAVNIVEALKQDPTLSGYEIAKPGADPSRILVIRESRPERADALQGGSAPSVAEMSAQLKGAGVDTQAIQTIPNNVAGVFNAHALMTADFSPEQINSIVAMPGDKGLNLQNAASLAQSGVSGANVVALFSAGAGAVAADLAGKGVNISAVMANGGVASVRAADRLDGRGVSAQSITTLAAAGVNLSDPAIRLPTTQSGVRDLTDINKLLAGGVPVQNVVTLMKEATSRGDLHGDVFTQASVILQRDGKDALNTLIAARPPADSSLSLEITRARHQTR